MKLSKRRRISHWRAPLLGARLYYGVLRQAIALALFGAAAVTLPGGASQLTRRSLGCSVQPFTTSGYMGKHACGPRGVRVVRDGAVLPAATGAGIAGAERAPRGAAMAAHSGRAACGSFGTGQCFPPAAVSAWLWRRPALRGAASQFVLSGLERLQSTPAT